MSTASPMPMQCLLMFSGVIGYTEDPTLKLRVRYLCDQQTEQVEEEKTPNGYESGKGRTRHVCPMFVDQAEEEKLPTPVKPEEDI